MLSRTCQLIQFKLQINDGSYTHQNKTFQNKFSIKRTEMQLNLRVSFLVLPGPNVIVDIVLREKNKKIFPIFAFYSIEQ